MFFKKSAKSAKKNPEKEVSGSWEAPPGRRNQTLVKKKPIDRGREKIFSRFLFKALVFLFVAVSFYAIVFSGYAEIGIVTVSGLQKIKKDEVSGEINRYLEEKHWKVFSKGNFFIFSESALTGRLEEEFGRIKKIEITKKFPNAIRVAIEERQALILWCVRSGCFVVDEDGNIYAKAEEESSELQQNELIRVSDFSAGEAEMGDNVLSAENVRFVLEVKKELEDELDIGMTDDLRIPSRVAQEINVKTEEGWEAYLNMRIPVEKTVRMLGTFLAKEIDEEDRKRLEYVDLRVEDKVFYKLREDEDDGEEGGEGGDNMEDENSVDNVPESPNL